MLICVTKGEEPTNDCFWCPNLNTLKVCYLQSNELINQDKKFITKFSWYTPNAIAIIHAIPAKATRAGHNLN